MTEKHQKLDILSFNVEGLDSILNEPSFHTLIENHDICFLTETMRKDDSKLGINGFWDHSLIRLKLKKEGRFSGGISVLVKTHLRNGVKIAHCSEGFLCIRLIKSFFNLPSDLYICGTYIPPYNTSKEILAKTDYFHELISLSNKFKELGNILILGDLNSRIGCNDDSLNNLVIPFLDNIISAFCSTPKLPSDTTSDPRVQNILTSLQNKLGESPPIDSLTSNFQSEEISKGIKALPTGKAVASDLICNEILKATWDIIISHTL